MAIILFITPPVYNEKYKKSKSLRIPSRAEESSSVSYERKTAKPFFNS